MNRNRKPLLDSSVMIERKADINQTLIEKMKLSIVVLYELTATTIRKSDFQELDNVRQTFHKRGDLPVPTMTDWWETAKMIRRLRLGEKTAAQGKTPKMPELTAYKTMRSLPAARVCTNASF